MDSVDPATGDVVDDRVLRTLGLLTRGALHEIASPLVGLIGSAELALREVEQGTRLHDRIALTHRTGVEIAEIVRALQAFVRGHGEPATTLSLGAAAAEAVSLVERVFPLDGASLTTSGDAEVQGSPGEVASRLVELLLVALRRDGSPGAIELAVRPENGEAVVTAGADELRLPLAGT